MSLKREWEIGAPINRHCCSSDCPNYNTQAADNGIATWTLLNPIDGGPPMYFCEECKNILENK